MAWGVFLHGVLGLLLLLGLPLLALLALPGFFRPLAPGVYRGVRALAWVAILQVLLGFFLFFLGFRPKEGLHLLYGLLLATGLHYLGGLGQPRSAPEGLSWSAGRLSWSAPEGLP